MDDYRLKLTVGTAYIDPRHLEDAAERLLDVLTDEYEDLGPIADGDYRRMTLSATIAFDADREMEEAVAFGRAVMASALDRAGVEATQLVDVHLTLVSSREPAPA